MFNFLDGSKYDMRVYKITTNNYTCVIHALLQLTIMVIHLFTLH